MIQKIMDIAIAVFEAMRAIFRLLYDKLSKAKERNFEKEIFPMEMRLPDRNDRDKLTVRRRARRRISSETDDYEQALEKHQSEQIDKQWRFGNRGRMRLEAYNEETSRKRFKEFISHDYSYNIGMPKFLSKGFSSRLIIYINLSELNARIIEEISKEFETQFGDQLKGEIFGKKISVTITTLDFEIAGEFKNILIDKPLTEISILVRPKDQIKCDTPIPIDISIMESETGHILATLHKSVVVKDYLIDHISRPKINTLSQACSFVSGTLFIILSLLGKLGEAHIFSIPIATILFSIGAINMISNRNYKSIKTD